MTARLKGLIRAYKWVNDHFDIVFGENLPVRIDFCCGDVGRRPFSFYDYRRRNMDNRWCGIDHGDLLLVGTEDFYGDPVNTASKLGEDLAIRGETLVTDRAIAESSYVASENVERMTARISDIEISYLRLPMTELATGR